MSELVYEEDCPCFKFGSCPTNEIHKGDVNV